MLSPVGSPVWQPIINNYEIKILENIGRWNSWKPFEIGAFIDHWCRTLCDTSERSFKRRFFVSAIAVLAQSTRLADSKIESNFPSTYITKLENFCCLQASSANVKLLKPINRRQTKKLFFIFLALNPSKLNISVQFRPKKFANNPITSENYRFRIITISSRSANAIFHSNKMLNARHSGLIYKTLTVRKYKSIQCYVWQCYDWNQ